MNVNKVKEAIDVLYKECLTIGIELSDSHTIGNIIDLCDTKEGLDSIIDYMQQVYEDDCITQEQQEFNDEEENDCRCNEEQLDETTDKDSLYNAILSLIYSDDENCECGSNCACTKCQAKIDAERKAQEKCYENRCTSEKVKSEELDKVMAIAKKIFGENADISIKRLL